MLWGVARGKKRCSEEELLGEICLNLLWEKECGSEFIIEIKKHVQYSSTCFKKSLE
ncbi:MAG: hypothetical protein KBC30_11215 [Planctomycetes bacterium]|nr:hypothetical protein [Planctomycetota bacterium]HNZ67446.1 hypothetical protein [Planctomycetota bacterium]HPY76051.1 hypothetical protein [Planctomycetota bacterium]HQB01578.1 hypothetical protein [Planctomycetota bacterium]